LTDEIEVMREEAEEEAEGLRERMAELEIQARFNLCITYYGEF
jgi:hypothetical protein